MRPVTVPRADRMFLPLSVQRIDRLEPAQLAGQGAIARLARAAFGRDDLVAAVAIDVVRVVGLIDPRNLVPLPGRSPVPPPGAEHVPYAISIDVGGEDVGARLRLVAVDQLVPIPHDRRRRLPAFPDLDPRLAQHLHLTALLARELDLPVAVHIAGPGLVGADAPIDRFLLPGLPAILRGVQHQPGIEVVRRVPTALLHLGHEDPDGAVLLPRGQGMRVDHRARHLVLHPGVLRIFDRPVLEPGHTPVQELRLGNHDVRPPIPRDVDQRDAAHLTEAGGVVLLLPQP